MEASRLLQHAEEIRLAQQVQRFVELENIFATLSAEREEEEEQQQRRRAARSGVDAGSRAAWAAAANLTVAELRTQLADGQRARERIVYANVRLVSASIKALKRSSGGQLDAGITEHDLLQEGCISLLRAVERFDVSLGLRFSTYATFWIRAAIKRALNEQSRVVRLPGRVLNDAARIQRAAEALRVRRGGESAPSDAEIAEELQAEQGSSSRKLSPQRVRFILQTARSRPSSLDAAVRPGSRGGADPGATVLDLVADSRSSSEAGLVHSMLRGDLDALMQRHLTAEEERMLRLRFGLGDGTARTIRAAGEEMGISYVRAKSLLFGAMHKMRKPHVARALRDYMSDDADAATS
jgi:RNA polymerase sigma factor (sigma-70 family)